MGWVRRGGSKMVVFSFVRSAISNRPIHARDLVCWGVAIILLPLKDATKLFWVCALKKKTKRKQRKPCTSRRPTHLPSLPLLADSVQTCHATRHSCPARSPRLSCGSDSWGFYGYPRTDWSPRPEVLCRTERPTLGVRSQPRAENASRLSSSWLR